LSTSRSSSPENTIAAAADISMLDHMQRFADCALRRLEETQRPLLPRQRMQLLRAVAILRTQLKEG